jgi:type VI secretion system protein ImpF
MTSRINPTLFDKLVADLELDGMRDDAEATADGPPPSLRHYTVPRIERFNEAALRATVLRELNWLLNTTNLSALQKLDAYPEVATSTLNYGLGDLAGKLLHRNGLQARAREMRDAIWRFEPRVEPHTLDVEPSLESERANSVTFLIRGDVSTAVAALPVEFRTDIEIDTGAATLWGD